MLKKNQQQADWPVIRINRMLMGDVLRWLQWMLICLHLWPSSFKLGHTLMSNLWG